MNTNKPILDTFNLWQLLAIVLVLVGLSLSPYLAYGVKLLML